MAKENFESKMKKLEEILSKLEQGELSLEQSLEEYKKGIALSKELKAFLTDFENKIEILNQKDDSVADSDA